MSIKLLLVLFLLISTAVCACNSIPPDETLPVSSLPENAPLDRPVEIDSDLEEQLELVIAQARSTLPLARVRFQNGLAPNHIMFITTRIYDDVTYEQIFVSVAKWDGMQIEGAIASNVVQVRGFKFGERITVAEQDVIDWMISRPDGSEEGNLVGKFLDAWQDQARDH